MDDLLKFEFGLDDDNDGLTRFEQALGLQREPPSLGTPPVAMSAFARAELRDALAKNIQTSHAGVSTIDPTLLDKLARERQTPLRKALTFTRENLVAAARHVKTILRDGFTLEDLIKSEEENGDELSQINVARLRACRDLGLL